MMKTGVLFALVCGSGGLCAGAPAAGSPSMEGDTLVGDGATMNTATFNAAIDKLSKAGGGVLFLKPGRYLTGTIYLKSGVTLHLENGAEILGSTNIADYPENPPPSPSTTLEFGRYSLIYAAGQHDIAITGEGKISGQGSSPNFTKKILIERGYSDADALYKRPFGLCLVGCRHVQVRNVTLEDIAFWTEDYLDCDDVVVDGVSVNNSKEDFNNDGIDVDGSRNVRISNCNFYAGDDGICLKSSYSMCEHVTITNCIVRSLCNGIKFGTASRCGFKNIAISNCVIHATGVAGMALEVVDGGVLDGVTVANLAMEDVGTPVFIRLGNRGKRFLNNQSPASVGTLRNVTITGITSTVSRRDGTFACPISGLPGHPIENLRISNVRIFLQEGSGNVHLDDFQSHYLREATRIIEQTFGGQIKNVTVRDVPENPADYPEYPMFGPLPAYGFFCRHVNNIAFEGLDLRFEKAESRSAFAFYDVHGLNLDGFHAESSPGSNAVLLLRDVADALFRGAVAREGTPVFLRVEGNSDDIHLYDSDLSRAASAVSLETGLESRRITLGTDVVMPASRPAIQK